MRTDPVLLEILSQRFRSVAEEMGYALQRTGYTAFVNETADLGVALVTPGGEVFGYPRAIGITMFANLDFARVIDQFPDWAPGDVVIYNDPYTTAGAASHLPDVNVLAPVFVEDALLCFVFAYVHSTDVGGNVPGSLSPTNHEVFQEGVRIPPLKLYRGGTRNDDLLRLILNNVRVPDDNAGDLRAMLTALRVGERRVLELAARYGRAAFADAMGDVLDYSEARARKVIERIPEGTYRFVDYLDDDVGSPIPIRFAVAVTVRGGGLHLDFSESDVQVRSAFNLYTQGRMHPWVAYKLMFLILTLEDDIPVNAGVMRPVTFAAREGSVLNCAFPAAIGLRTTSGVRAQDAIFGALALALPGSIPAAGAGTIAPIVFAERDDAGAMKVNVLEPMSGGTGGSAHGDGQHARDVVDIANLRNSPLESVEAKASVRVRRYGLRPDSAGPGKFRGGCGAVFEFEVLAPDCVITARGMERHRFRPWGVRGGGCGAAGAVHLKRAGAAGFEASGKIDALRVSTGDVVRVEIAGGGGYGDPFEREPAAVLRDVADGFVTVDAARRDYGVAIEGGKVDEPPTARLRADRRTVSAAVHTLGAEREAYERVWTDAVWHAFLEVLYGLPPAMRHEARGWLWREIEARAQRGQRTDADGVQALWQTRGNPAQADVERAA